MKRLYLPWSPRGEALDIIAKANEIIADYRSQGYELTLRQLYYQFVARALIPNNDRSYKRLGSYVDKGRLAGLINWSGIVDRTRSLSGGDNITSDPEAVIRSYADYVDVSRWDDQPTAVEVWVEKEALAGVVERAASEWFVPYFSCRGYPSQSSVHQAGRRIGRYLKDQRNVLILHLGDHDPSGIDMTRDIRERLENFVMIDWMHEMMRGTHGFTVASIEESIANHVLTDSAGRFGMEVRRIALNADQIEQYQPPPNPTKLTDSRAEGYIERFGHESWELDALDPSTINELIATNIEPVIDQSRWEAKIGQRDALRQQYVTVADNWDEIQDTYGEGSFE